MRSISIFQMYAPSTFFSTSTIALMSDVVAFWANSAALTLPLFQPSSMRYCTSALKLYVVPTAPSVPYGNDAMSISS